MKQIRQIFLFLLILVLSDCKQRPTFPASPEISFLEMKKIKTMGSSGYKDSVTITLSFKDGDGDLGSYETQNYFADLLAKQDGVFKKIVVKDTIPVVYLDKNGTFPPLNPDGRQGPIEGTLSYGVSTELAKYFGNLANVSIKFKVYIKDNAGHSSNTIETPEVTIRNYQIPEDEN
jgi:hypothetical protein